MTILKDLNGINFSNKYYDPSKPFRLENEFFEFYTTPVKSSLECKFKSDYYNSEYLTNELTIYENFNRLFKKMQINKYKISEIKDLFSEYTNINFNELFIDLTKNISYELTNNYKQKHDEIISYYRNVLKEYGIEADDDNLDKLFDHIFYQNEEKYALCANYDLELLLQENIENSNNLRFKLAYIRYLQLVNSSHNNLMDEHHYFDNNQIPDNVLFYCFYQINVILPVNIIKQIALAKNHIVDGKGIGILRHKSSANDLKRVAEKYGLKKSGTKKALIKRIEKNLTNEEINTEFTGNRFILTEAGEKFLKKFDNYNFKYFQSLPACFESIELDILCQNNPEHPIEDIIYAIVKEDWCKIKNPKRFSKDSLDHLKFSINDNRYFLAKVFEKDYPNRAIELYELCLKKQYNPHYGEKFIKICKKHNMTDRPIKLISDCINETKKKIEENTPKIDKKTFNKNINKILKNLKELIKLNNNKQTLKILNILYDRFKKSSSNPNLFMEYNQDYILEEIEVLNLPLIGYAKFDELINLAISMESMFENIELNKLKNLLNELEHHYDLLKT